MQEPPLRSLLGTVAVDLLPGILSIVGGFTSPGMVTITSTLKITYEDIRGLCMHVYDEYKLNIYVAMHVALYIYI